MIARTLIEKIPSARWRLAELISKTVYSKAFATLGDHSVIVRPLKLSGLERIRIGDHVAIFEGAWLAAEEKGRLEIGDSTYIGHHCHIHAFDDITIGAHCVFADNVLVNSAEHRRHDLSQVAAKGPIFIGDHVFLGQNAVILGGVTIGDNAVVGAGAVVTRDVPAGATVGGVPARIITSPSNA